MSQFNLVTFFILIPAVRLLASERRALLISFITYNSEIMSPYSYCAKRGLVYIIIVNLSGRQLSFCPKYTKLNT